MSHAFPHPLRPFRIVSSPVARPAQEVGGLSEALHRRDAATAASSDYPLEPALAAALAAAPISLAAIRRASQQRRSAVVRISNTLGLFAALYAAIVLMRFAG